MVGISNLQLAGILHSSSVPSRHLCQDLEKRGFDVFSPQNASRHFDASTLPFHMSVVYVFGSQF